MLQIRVLGVALPLDWINSKMYFFMLQNVFVQSANVFVQTANIILDAATAQYFERMTLPQDWLQAFT